MFTSGNGKSSEGKIEQDSILEINLPEKDERKERSKNLKAGHVSKLESDCSTKVACLPFLFLNSVYISQTF
jgi:hypothetical protein